MLEVNDLSCGYGQQDVVKGVSFTLPENGRLAILGPNGCGKTTLLRGMTGFLPAAGSVTLDGADLLKMPPRERGRAVAELPQVSTAWFAYTVLETVLMGRYAHLKPGLFSTPTRKDREIAEDAIRRLGLWEERDRPLTQLSGGQLQRVLLARAFTQTPRVILLDEPTNHLDLKYQVELVEVLKAWSSQPGHAALGVFHDLDLALDFASLVLLMDAGQAVYFGDANDLPPAALSRVFGLDVPAYMRQSRARWEKIGGQR